MWRWIISERAVPFLCCAAPPSCLSACALACLLAACLPVSPFSAPPLPLVSDSLSELARRSKANRTARVPRLYRRRLRERESRGIEIGCGELHAFCKTAEILELSHPQEITLNKTAVGSALINNQNVCCTAEVPGENAEVMQFSLLQDESDTAATSLLPLPLLSCTPRSMVPLSVPSSSDLGTILSPDSVCSGLQLKEINYNAAAMDESAEFLHLFLSGNEGYNTASEFQFWDVLDFYVSENFSALQFNSLMGFTNEVSTSYHDSMNLVDMVEQPVALLSLDDTAETNNTSDEVPVDHNITDPDETSLYLQTKLTDSESEGTPASGDIVETEYLDQKLLSRGLPDLMDVDSPCPILKSPGRTKNVTLVLDLDETLVHSTLDHCENADFILEVFFNMKNNTVYVKERPHLKMFLEKTAEMFELVIFTASQRIYAEQLIDRLDPDGKLITQRVYRDSCKFSDGCYIKDLTILGIDLAKVAIIDNTPQVFQLQVDNGIPIKSWFDDPSDQELVELLPFLEGLVDAEDVRPIILKTFHDKTQQI